MMWRSDKKLDHQRQSMARNEKQQSLKPSSKLRNTDIKISEAILHLCEPLRKQYKDNNRIKVIISITVMAWNISLFPKEEQANAQEILSSPLLNQLKKEEAAVLLENIKTLIDRKNMNYPCVRDFILKHTLSFLGDTITLTVETTEVPEEIQRKVSPETSRKGGYNFKA